MKSTSIKNVVFDIGNVIVRWAPLEIIRLTFGNDRDHQELAKAIFQSDTWMDLNKGFISEEEAKVRYQTSLGLSDLECERLFYYVKHTQLQIFGSVDLVKRVKASGYNVYALTDNVHEIVAYLKSTYSFWSLFEGATVSADLGLLKPQAAIYQALLKQNDIEPSETVFIDDMPYNVEGAKAEGIAAIQFENAAQCEEALKALGLSLE